MRSTWANCVTIDMIGQRNLSALLCIQKNLHKMHRNGNRERFVRFPIFQRNLIRANFLQPNLSKLSQSDDGDCPKLIIENDYKCKIYFTICCHCCCCISAASVQSFAIVTLCECRVCMRCRSCLSASMWAFSSLAASTWQVWSVNVWKFLIVVHWARKQCFQATAIGYVCVDCEFQLL